MNSHNVNQVAILYYRPMSISHRTLCFFHKSKLSLITCGQLRIQYSNGRDAQKAFTAVAADLADTLVVLRSNVRSLANGSGRRK